MCVKNGLLQLHAVQEQLLRHAAVFRPDAASVPRRRVLQLAVSFGLLRQHPLLLVASLAMWCAAFSRYDSKQNKQTKKLKI